MLLLDHLVCELKASQSAMYLIRKYAVDKESGDALLEWLHPFELFVYKRKDRDADDDRSTRHGQISTHSENITWLELGS